MFLNNRDLHTGTRQKHRGSKTTRSRTHNHHIVLFGESHSSFYFSLLAKKEERRPKPPLMVQVKRF